MPTKQGGTVLLEEATRAFNHKQNWDQLCQEVAHYFYPEKSDFTEDIYIGEEFADHIVDPSTIYMRRSLGENFSTMLRSGEWFSIGVNDPDLMKFNPVRRKLDQMDRITRLVLYSTQSGFKRATSEGDHDFAAFGGTVISANLNRLRNGVSFQTWHMRDCAWLEDREGNIDRVYRKWHTTAGHVAEQFKNVPGARIPQHIQQSVNDGNRDSKVTIYHCVRPVLEGDAYETMRRYPPNTPYISMYVDDESEIILEQAEIEFPYVIPRWRLVRTWGAYPYSPAAITGLPLGRVLQRMMLTLLEAGEKSVDPPLIATSNVVSGPIDLASRAVTWIDDEYDERLGSAIRPLELGKNVPLGERMIVDVRAIQEEIWYLNRLQLPDTRSRTAYEVSQIVQETARQALPLFEPIQDLYNTALLENVVSKGLRLGWYGTPDSFPQEMGGQKIEYTYNNPLSAAIEQARVGQFQQTLEIVGGAAQLDQQAAINVDLNAAVRDSVSATGAPNEWLVPEEQVRQTIAQMQEQIQAQQQMQQAQEAAGAVNEGAQAAMSVAQADQALPAQEGV